MSTKRNKKKKIDSYLMNLAFEQAKINLGSTKDNPSVGCVIEKNGCLISSGCTSLDGRPHAEFNALNKKINFKDANLYVTLEPCTHHGKTPPCTTKIIKKKIKKVYFSINDIDKRTSYKSENLKKKKKINVRTNLLNEAGYKFYEYYLKTSKELPLIDAKIAISNDYYSCNKKKRWITNVQSRNRVHFLRSSYDCIISTYKTINADNSLFNCRIDGLENKSPTIVIIDKDMKIKKNLKIFKNLNKKKIFIVTSKHNSKKIIYFKKKGIKFLRTKDTYNFKNMFNIFMKLKSLGYSRLFVESGLTFLHFLIRSKFINYLYIFKSKNKINKCGFNPRSVYFIKKFNLKNRIKVNLFGDMLYKNKLK